ncbi:MAG: hypothetical protein WC010_01780 [Candidatus Absconditabacterales bacterium]
MSQKLGLFFTFLLFFSVTSVYAQTGNQQTGSEQIIKPSIQVQAFSNLRARHCDQGLESELLTVQSSLVLNISESKTLCNVFINDGDFPIKVKYSYVDSSIGDMGTSNCDIAGSIFPSLISIPEPTTFTIPANSNIVRYDKMFLPPGMSGGIIRGCLGYGIVSLETKPGDEVSMFKIENRKVILYDVLVGGQTSIENSVSLEPQKSDVFTTNKKIKIALNKEGGVVVSATIKNNGNVDQMIVLSGKIYNFLGFEKEFSIKETKIGPYQTIEFPIIIDVIPSYKGIFDFKVSILHTPSLAFENFNLPENSLKGGVFYETGKFFIFSRYAIGVIAFLLLILWLLIKSILPRRRQQQEIQQQ